VGNTRQMTFEEQFRKIETVASRRQARLNGREEGLRSQLVGVRTTISELRDQIEKAQDGYGNLEHLDRQLERKMQRESELEQQLHELGG
jgi:chromosome segregation ATPase